MCVCVCVCVCVYVPMCDQFGRGQCRGKPPAWLKGGEVKSFDLGWHWSLGQLSQSTNVLRSARRLFWAYSATLGSNDATETLQGQAHH